MKYCFFAIQLPDSSYQQGVVFADKSTLLFLLEKYPGSLVVTHIEISKEEYTSLSEYYGGLKNKENSNA